MTDNDYKQIKLLVLSELKNRYAEATVTLWFEEMRVVSLEANIVTLSFPTTKKAFIEMQYYHVLKDLYGKILGFEVDIKFITDEEESNLRLGINKMREEDEEDINLSAYKMRFNPDYTFENFVVGKSNELAHAAAEAVATHPARLNNPLYFYGPSGLGKTHLMFAIVNEIRKKFPNYNILYVTGEEFTNELVSSLAEKKPMIFREKYRNLDVLLVDDIQFIGGKMMIQEEFFHTFDALFKMNKQIILASDCAPKDIQGLEDRLRSRFVMGLVADIQPPDMELRIAIFQRKTKDYGFDLDMDVLYYLAQNITTNIRQIEGACKKLMAHALLHGEKITYPLAKTILSEFFAVEKSKASKIDKIFEYIARRYGVTEEELKSKKRNADITAARHCAVYIIRKSTNLSQKDVGRMFNKDHTTIIYSVSTVEKKMQEDPAFEREINAFLAELEKN
ncbi:MAG: chromosomal replication initiator protein DnaA [Clostridia bacterium]|nr:chromosomal replication initiator protein DnaA [Clostridia bacterium]MBR5278411.1 chromosomal replication initiator protein DnaA [Clostridia bacterium]